MKSLLSIFPFVASTKAELEKQNKLLNKITLTGKINALDVASTLFEFTDATSITFNELQEELVEALLDENAKKLNSELHSKAQIAIDILIRNLFERTADVGFLATDSVIIDFLTNDHIRLETMQQRLIEYIAKYSVYNEIVIFDTDGNAKANINSENIITQSNDSILQEALQSDSYIERYAHSDIFKKQNKTLIYAQKIVSNSQPIGVLCLCFKFDDELKRILTNLGTSAESVAIADHEGLIASNDSSFKNAPAYKNAPYQVLENQKIGVTVRTKGYQGYSGISTWYGLCIGNTARSRIQTQNESQQQKSAVALNEKLSSIIEKADNLVEDLNDVIINGELIASKRKVYVLHPILNSLRDISTSLLDIIKSSITNLENLIGAALINDAKTAAHLAIDIMDRNLYERANDCRWWALTPLFQEQLVQENPDTAAMNKTLLYINDLYTVYTNLFIYDKDRKIVAASNDQSIVGTTFDNAVIGKLLVNNDTQNYFVTEFEESPFYDLRPTYIYNATITNNAYSVGGIGIVFDGEVEFKAMLQESFPSGKDGFSLFVDTKKRIIASSSDKYKPLQTIELDDKFFNPKIQHAIYDSVVFDEKHYVVASAVSKGYREYKTEDNYKNILFSIVFIAV
jgi:hypothetical protein